MANSQKIHNLDKDSNYNTLLNTANLLNRSYNSTKSNNQQNTGKSNSFSILNDAYSEIQDLNNNLLTSNSKSTTNLTDDDDCVFAADSTISNLSTFVILNGRNLKDNIKNKDETKDFVDIKLLEYLDEESEDKEPIVLSALNKSRKRKQNQIDETTKKKESSAQIIN